MTEIPTQGPLNVEQIEALLPHRYPFLLIDRVLDWELEPEKKLRAIKNVTTNEPFFTGHFPGHPVMPGVLIVESMAQAAGVLACVSKAAGERRGNMFYLVKVDNARFAKTVTPGDQLLLEVTQKRIMRNMGQYVCTASVDGKVVASCELLSASPRGSE
ncbi:MAG: 3-hydroxyacyl-ACP dehydratase FabZ [Xanthomonadales bacterium]|nr:3-hydroxyacyl-ACP dehydratase FabZ [Xanthomonadales bacterium]